MFGKIHTSLTNMVTPGEDEETHKSNQRKATNLFRSIFGIMGDKKIVEVDGALHEVLLEVGSRGRRRREGKTRQRQRQQRQRNSKD